MQELVKLKRYGYDILTKRLLHSKTFILHGFISILNELRQFEPHLLLPHHSLRLLVGHLVAVHLAQVAHVADFAETEVVVEASLANPVSRSLLVAGLVLVHSVVLGVLVGNGLLDRVVVVLSDLPLLARSVGHVIWLAFHILFGLLLLASIASLATLEVVVLALAALPASFWELKQSLVVI